jgi:2-methylcitrate dehydratase PrpD
MSILDVLTKHLEETDYYNLPSDAVQEAKKQVLGMIGAMIAGSTCSVSGEIQGLVDLVKDWGGKEESTIVAFGLRVPAPNAALVNGTLCVRRDFDDTNLKYSGGHTSRSIIPTAFAMAEHLGKVDGKKLINAIVLGHDLECRMYFAAPNIGNWYLVTNFFGATATAAKILGLGKEKLRYALAFAFHQICGAAAGGGSGDLGSIKGMSNGFAARAGVLGALLAEKGFTVDWDFLDPSNRHNFYELFFGKSGSSVLLTMDLGKIYMGTNTISKSFPCCHGQHTTLMATLALLRDHAYKPDEIAEVTLHLPAQNYLALTQPAEKKQNPKNIIESQFSLCWGVASAIVYGDIGIKNFSEEALQDIRIRDMARRVHGKPETEFSLAKGVQVPTQTMVEITTRDGGVFSKYLEKASGSPEELLTYDDVAKKFIQCCRYSIKPIPEKNQEKVIEMVADLENINDVSHIIRLVT